MTASPVDPNEKPLRPSELAEDANRIERDSHKLRDTRLPASESESLREEEQRETPPVPNITRLPPD